jgi:tripartite-type tricarboxylate transporter receptor subunit TctC
MTLVSVHPDAPYKDFGDFLKAMKEDPQSVSVATAGVPSSGHSAIEAIKSAAGGDYKLVNYDGGNPAVKATVSGETLATPQLLSEQIEFIRAKRLRPLAVLKSDALEIDGYGEVPPITKWLPDFKAGGPIHFGIWAPKGIPQEVVDTMNDVWKNHVVGSKALKDYAYQKGLAVTPFYGEEALKRSWPVIQATAWGYQDAGKAVVSPDSVGIPRP